MFGEGFTYAFKNSWQYIREQVLDKIILYKLRQMTAFARANPQEFYEMATENGEAEAKQFYATAEKGKQRLRAKSRNSTI